MIIQVKDVKRSFRSVIKEPGLKGAFKLLTSPQYSTFEALKGVSFTIEAGSFVGLIGANGAGKTTLLKILSGLIPPTSGEVSVLDQKPFDRALSFRNQIALVMGQKAQLWWDLPAIDAFDLLRAVYQIEGKVFKDRVKLLSELLGVDKMLQTQIRRLSLGERMKMELIGALIHWPKVIYLDEPTIGLDVFAAHKLREFLREFNHREKATIILTSHNMDDIESLCSRVMILREGNFVYDGTPRGLTDASEMRLKLVLPETPEREALAQAIGLTTDAIDQGSEEEGARQTYWVSMDRTLMMPTLERAMKSYRVAEMGTEEQGLERVIQRLFEKNEKSR